MSSDWKSAAIPRSDQNDTDPAVNDDETATTIVTQWLATDPVNAKRFRVSYETQGVAGLRSEAGAYIITTVGVSGIAGTLLRWGMTHDPQLSSRGNVLEWACQHMDWENVGRGLADGAIG